MKRIIEFLKATDKQLHILVNFGLMLAVYLILSARPVLGICAGLAVSCLVSYAKEYIDAERYVHPIDKGDLIADAIGAGLALVLIVCVLLWVK